MKKTSLISVLLMAPVALGFLSACGDGTDGKVSIRTKNTSTRIKGPQVLAVQAADEQAEKFGADAEYMIPHDRGDIEARVEAVRFKGLPSKAEDLVGSYELTGVTLLIRKKDGAKLASNHPILNQGKGKGRLTGPSGETRFSLVSSQYANEFGKEVNEFVFDDVVAEKIEFFGDRFQASSLLQYSLGFDDNQFANEVTEESVSASEVSTDSEEAESTEGSSDSSSGAASVGEKSPTLPGFLELIVGENIQARGSYKLTRGVGEREEVRLVEDGQKLMVEHKFFSESGFEKQLLVFYVKKPAKAAGSAKTQQPSK